MICIFENYQFFSAHQIKYGNLMTKSSLCFGYLAENNKILVYLYIKYIIQHHMLGLKKLSVIYFPLNSI